ncbi:FxsA family protein [Falsihalocynthiibacter arcticus]|uniref:Exlusion protein FxsA n=1 Tax=Falsihalocynthiibacter arcticus TaxID=1579316 RepID=A0A126UXS2_9RHOB|nr:FxsA family protein [Falsihalocynthiibacter arcticus]AML50862.1 exlusion protein FxsA [Falsihalocynthiibacter arcticus]
MWLLIAFIAIPIIEITLFLEVGGIIGTWPTVGIVILTAVVGSYLMRVQGAMALSSLQASFQEMRDPTVPIANGAMILLAGALLVTPGFFTDSIGILLLLPPFRALVIKFVGSRMNVQSFSTSGFSNNPRYKSDEEGVIDGDYARVEPDAPHIDPPSNGTKD